jgi:hypothetical protein
MPTSSATRSSRPQASARRGWSPRQVRDASRALHLGAAAVLLVYVYGTAGLTDAMRPWL